MKNFVKSYIKRASIISLQKYAKPAEPFMGMSSTHKGLSKTVSIVFVDSIFIYLLLSLCNYIQLNEEILLLYYNNR